MQKLRKRTTIIYSKKRKIQKKIHENLEKLLELNKEKVLPDVAISNKNMANDFVNYFEEKIERICLSLTSENSQSSPDVTLERNNKFSKFKILSIDDF